MRTSLPWLALTLSLSQREREPQFYDLGAIVVAIKFVSRSLLLFASSNSHFLPFVVKSHSSRLVKMPRLQAEAQIFLEPHFQIDFALRLK